MSTFTWLDYSEHERRLAMEVIDLFAEDETRDELGLGTLRDAFADLLFPGTSTIQTRARYFLFVPWTCQELERQRIPSSTAAARARVLQGKLRDALIAGGEDAGVIGFRAGLHVQRLPASVYWFGLRRWDLLRFEGTEDDYRRYLDTFHRCREGTPLADGGEAADAVPSNWDPHLPAPPPDWLKNATFGLTAAEAEYLYQRVASRAPDSLITHLLVTRQAITDHQLFPWDVAYQVPLAPRLANQLDHARNFSEVMHGAALLYNLLLAEQKKGGEFADRYRERLGEWWDRLRARREELLVWDRPAFWRLVVTELGARVRGVTRQFVDQWLTLALSAPSLAAVADNPLGRRLVADQEQRVKPGRARIGNDRATESWEGSSGSAQLNYRWNRPVRAIVNDILAPFTAGMAHRAVAGA